MNDWSLDHIFSDDIRVIDLKTPADLGGDSNIVGVVTFELIDIGTNFQLNVTWTGGTIPSTCYPVTGGSLLDIDLSFTGVQNNQWVELVFKLGPNVPATFITNKSITAGDLFAWGTLRRLDRGDNSSTFQRIVSKRQDGSNPFPYNVGLVIMHGDHPMPTFLDPKIKNNG